jgi:hypothetical protein
MKVARMMGFEVRREQLVRIGIAAAVLLVVLLIGLWAIAKALGLLFWGVLVVGAAAVAVKLFGSRPAAETRRVAPNTPRQVESEDSALRAWNADAERKADQALEELERKLKG